MLLTFIFNYFPPRLRGVATLSSIVSCPAQSSISHSFFVYQVDKFMLHIHMHIHTLTHTRAHKSPTRRQHKENLVLGEARGIRRESRESRSTLLVFFLLRLQKIWPQNVRLCWWPVVFSAWRKGSIFSHSRWRIFPPASELDASCKLGSPPGMRRFPRNEKGKKLFLVHQMPSSCAWRS